MLNFKKLFEKFVNIEKQTETVKLKKHQEENFQILKMQKKAVKIKM